MRIYGITGGTGSGKSEVARQFAKHGVPVIDADAVGHEVIAPGGAAEKDVLDAFGSGILTDGKIDRAKLGARVFTDPEALRRLNAIVHPAIGMTIALKCAALAEEGNAMVMIDAALIADKGVKDAYLSGLILVLCPEDERVRRLVEHRGLSEAEARKRISAQTPPECKLALADWVIENTGSKDALYARVDALAEELHGHGE
ncbi:MAG: dephospho-CoA kinase [Candidatus Hydrogenedentes bacterium]|nr:dephospho-CoA kinase [Candidatus Hydrogenedentota bacterium]